MRIRDYVPTDLPYLYDICLKTGNSGKDASTLYSDPFLLGQYYAAPYAHYDARAVLILEGEFEGARRPLGYILGVADTAAYNAWFDRAWRPGAVAQYGDGPVLSELERKLRLRFSAPLELPPFYREYPGHMHIDLLPAAQGSGWGSKLMDAFSDRLHALGSTGFHLGVGKQNEHGLAFYRRYGMTELDKLDWGSYFGKKLQESNA